MIDKPNGDRADIRLIRSVDWIETHNAKVGGEIFLDLPHMGARGFAHVMAIEPCPPLGQGAGRIVTGTFCHTSGEVYDLKLESESNAIGVTSTHPFWSLDRNAWVSAIDLKIGETLKTLSGTTVVESRSKREEPETVYNIEVEGDHVYRVGESGVLVHNQSAGADGNSSQNESTPEQPDHVFATGLRPNLSEFADSLGCCCPDVAAALLNAQSQLQGTPFDLTVTRVIPRPDSHSIAFGNALERMRSEIEAFLETWLVKTVMLRLLPTNPGCGVRGCN